MTTMSDVAPHPDALVPDPDMLSPRLRPIDGATYRAVDCEPFVTDLVAVVYRLAYNQAFFSGYSTGFGAGHAEGRAEGLERADRTLDTAEQAIAAANADVERWQRLQVLLHDAGHPMPAEPEHVLALLGGTVVQDGRFEGEFGDGEVPGG